MATDLLASLSPAQLDQLLAQLEERRAGKVIHGKKVDFESMTPQQLAEVNKTLTPVTFKTEHFDYPRCLYGMREGQLVTVTVNDEDHELLIREKWDYNWKYSMLEHGIETCPTHGDGIKAVDIAPVSGVALPETIAPAAFAQGAIEATRREEGKKSKKAA